MPWLRPEELNKPSEPPPFSALAGAAGYMAYRLPLLSGLRLSLPVQVALASIVFFGHQMGSFIGVWLAGYLYDTTGSYLGAFSVSIGLGVLAALVNLPVNETPLAQRKPAAAAA